MLNSRSNKRFFDITVAEGCNTICYGTGDEKQEILIHAAAEVIIDEGFRQLDNQVMDNIKAVGDKTNGSQRFTGQESVEQGSR